MVWSLKFTDDVTYTFEYQVPNPKFVAYGPDNEEDEFLDESYNIPLVFEVCPFCEGKGKSSAYLGAITQSEREQDWDPDEWDNYMAGAYDKTCDTCKGHRVVKDVDLEGLPPEVKKAYEKACEEEDDYQQQCRMERMMGA